MTLVSVNALSYTYPGGTTPALSDVSLSFDRAEIVVASGHSGGGKSTLLRSFTGLVPQFYGGKYSGEVSVAGLNPATIPVRSMAAHAGLLFQEPETQAIADTVEEDVAFALEQRNVPWREMKLRVNQCLDQAGVGHLRGRRLATLSGGERQRTALAAILALGPPLLLLDEPCSQLDPSATKEIFDSLIRLRTQTGVTVVVAEHRIERWLPAADRVLHVSGGRVTTLTPREAAQLPGAPPVCKLGLRLGLTPAPLDASEARVMIGSAGRSPCVSVQRPAAPPGDELIAATGVTVRFGERIALESATLAVREGEIVAIVGPNGSGKSTLLRALAGTVKPASGDIRFQGQPAPAKVPTRTAFAGLCPQDPGAILRRDTVREELRATLDARRCRTDTGRVLEDWGLHRFAHRDPRDLSTGERERTATAAMLAHSPRAWLLDEPSRGADPGATEWLAAMLRRQAARGGCALVATHDIEAAARFATRVVGLERGRIAFDLPVREAMGSSGPVPTQVAGIVPGALFPEEVAW